MSSTMNNIDTLQQAVKDRELEKANDKAMHKTIIENKHNGSEK